MKLMPNAFSKGVETDTVIKFDRVLVWIVMAGLLMVSIAATFTVSTNDPIAFFWFRILPLGGIIIGLCILLVIRIRRNGFK